MPVAGIDRQEPLQAARCRLQGENRAGGHTEHERRSTRFFHEGFEVFNLTLNCIRLRVTAVASSPTIVVEHGEVLRQECSQLGRPWVNGSILECTTYQDDCRSLPRPIEGDRGAVFGRYFVHSVLLINESPSRYCTIWSRWAVWSSRPSSMPSPSRVASSLHLLTV